MLHWINRRDDYRWLYEYDGKKRWRYSIVKYKSNNSIAVDDIVPSQKSQELFDLEIASRIGPKHLDLFMTFPSLNPYLEGSVTELGEYIDKQFGNDHEKWSAEDLSSVRSTYEAVVNVRTHYPSIYRSLKLYHSLPRLRGYNELFVLGLFSVIESLLTHNPVGESDSINHQIASKAILLSNRFATEIDYSTFGDVNRVKLWKLLYGFRSKIAHGGEPDFSKQFQVLDSTYTVQRFLEGFLRSLLQNALSEPRLYVDLKEC